MIKVVVVGKISQVIAGIFGISPFLRQIEVEPSACFANMYFMAKAGCCFTIGQIPKAVAYSQLTTQIIHILFIVQFKQAGSYISVVVLAAAPYIGVYERYAGVVFQSLVKHQYIVV